MYTDDFQQRLVGFWDWFFGVVSWAWTNHAYLAAAFVIGLILLVPVVWVIHRIMVRISLALSRFWLRIRGREPQDQLE